VPLSSGGTFATDSEIADASAPHGRQLQRFDDFVDEKVIGGGGGGEGSAFRAALRDAETFGADAGGKWDQFEENKRLFGVTTSFDENEYTSRIKRDDPDFERREAEAVRLAREIERKSSNNLHIREERGFEDAAEDDADGEEEERFSGVRRELAATRNAGAAGVVDKRGNPIVAARGGSGKLSYAAAAAAAAAASPGDDAKDDTSNGGASRASNANAGARLSSPPASNRRSRESLTALARQSAPGRGSPGSLGSPGGRGSPRQADLSVASDIAEPASIINKLSLEAGTPGVGPETVKRFQDHKIKEDMKAVLQDRDRTTNEFKKFASDHPVGRGRGKDSGNEAAKTALEGAEKAAKTEDEGKVKDKGASGETEEDKEAGSEPKGKRPFKLNPKAKEFNLNVSAAEFIPGGFAASTSDASSDASVRIPSSPGPCELVYPQDTTGLHMAAAAAAAVAAGVGGPVGYASPVHYHPSYGMPQMAHMTQPGYPYTMPPQFQPGPGAPLGGAYYPGSPMQPALHYGGPPGPYPPQGGMAPGYAMPIGQPVAHPGSRQGGYPGMNRGSYSGPPQSQYGGPGTLPGPCGGGGRGNGGHRKSSKQHRQHYQNHQQQAQQQNHQQLQSPPPPPNDTATSSSTPAGKVGKGNAKDQPG
jgi:LsmAD domain